MSRALSFLEERENWHTAKNIELQTTAVLEKPIGEFEDMQRQSKVKPFDVLEANCLEGIKDREFSFRRSELYGTTRFLGVFGFISTRQNGRDILNFIGHFTKKVEQSSV